MSAVIVVATTDDAAEAIGSQRAGVNHGVWIRVGMKHRVGVANSGTTDPACVDRADAFNPNACHPVRVSSDLCLRLVGPCGIATRERSLRTAPRA